MKCYPRGAISRRDRLCRGSNLNIVVLVNDSILDGIRGKFPGLALLLFHKVTNVSLIYLDSWHTTSSSRFWNGVQVRESGKFYKGLVTNYGEGSGGLQNRRKGHVKFYPYEKGARKKF